MTDEQDGRPRRPAVDGPTVMGPSTGHRHGPAAQPAEPAPPPDDPAAAHHAPPATPARPGTPPDEPTLRAPAQPGTAPPWPSAPAPRQDDPTLADQATNATAAAGTGPHQPPTTADPTPATPTPRRPHTPQGDPTLADRAADDAPASHDAPGPGPTPTTTPPPWPGHPSAQGDEPTLAGPTAATRQDRHDQPTLPDQAPASHNAPGPAPPWPSARDDEPTVAEPTAGWPSAPAPPQGDPTVAGAWSDGPTVATPVDDTLPDRPDDPTVAVVDESPTTTGPTVAGWPLDELLPPPSTDLVWRPEVPEPPAAPRRPGYYIALGASVVLVVALVAAAALATVVRPTREVAGTARPTQAVPDITGSAPPPATTTVPPQTGPADHPLSSSTARMADATCALPRFDLADDRQAAFYAAAKTCADDAWRGVLDEAGLRAAVEVVTVTGPVRTPSCGELAPTSPATQCDGTVYMTPAHLRDTERNGRYPGRYFGVFLREYARALQYTTGLVDLTSTVDDAGTRLAQQATCMAGIASGAMANRGAVDANITGEIGDRLSSVDAPPDAKAFLDRGFEARTLEACSTW